MKQLYKLIALLAIVSASWPTAGAAEWSYDWPISATAASESDNNHPGGFYNFGKVFDATITSLTRTLNGKEWTISFDAGTKLTYLASSGQAVGAPNAYSTYFSLSTPSFSGKIKSITVCTRTKVADAMFTASVNGKAYECDGATSACYTVAGNTPKDFVFTPGADGAQEGEILLYFNIPEKQSNAYVKRITIEYEEAVSSVETPVISPEAGMFDEPVTVEITGAEGVTLLYTTDGSNPRAEGNESVKTYEAPFIVSETTTVKAAALSGGEYSAVAESTFVIRKSPELKFEKESLTIELLEEDLAILDNPYNVSPVKFTSSNTNVAWSDSYGHIYTYSVGEAVITASFAGNDKYMPQNVSIPVTVVAKEPLTGLTVSPGEGTYTGLTEVTVECTDPRAVTLWYYLGDKAMTVDDLGTLDEYTINPSTKMTLKLDHSCVLTVQAVGNNVWSEPQVVNYTINMPLEAHFEAGESYNTVYRNGFDSEEEANEWNSSTGSNWQLTSAAGGFRDVPPFSSINPESKYSLYHQYANTGDISVITSPDITIPDNGKVRFYAMFNPVWIYNGNLILYICENTDGATPTRIWDAFMASQEAATDDIKWTQYSVDLDAYAGKEVYFAFAYALTDGDNVVIDDFEVVSPAESTQIKAVCGEPVKFKDLSTGEPDAWEWQFPGAVTETSSEREPEVVYNKPGTYDVTLTVRKGEETNTLTRQKYVVVHGVAPTAAIGLPSGVYHSPEAGLVVPLNTPVTFTDQSKGLPTAYAWTLPGTDLLTADTKDVTVKYLQAGTYDVDLTVSNDAGSSSTYLHGVKAGGESLIWNIAAHENGNLGIIALGWYGNYGGTNWLDMEAFAEEFETPAMPVTISSVNVYFASTKTISPDAQITVSIAHPDENGLPGQAVRTAQMPVSQLVDASETYNDPTTFTFDTPVKMEGKYFVTISGFPNNSGDDGTDDIAMYALRRQPGEKGTTYHLLKETDENYNYTGEVKWYPQDEDVCSFAVAPKVQFDDPLSGVENVEASIEDAPAVYYNLQGIRVAAENLTPGIYIRRQGSQSTKVLVK